MAKVVYKNSVFRVEKLNIRRKGRSYIQYRVDYNTPIVVVLPILGRNQILIERQYRGALGKHIYEIPAGRLNLGESLTGCAKRELEEETGYRAATVKPMFADYPSPGIMGRMRYYFVATGLRKGESSPDEYEEIEVKRRCSRQKRSSNRTLCRGPG